MRESLPTGENSPGLGGLLAGMRRARGLSARALARRAGVTHVTVRAWEQGERQPRVPELLAVLAALDTGPAERRRALALVEAPRALVQVRREAVGVDWAAGPAPSGGDLLRVLRLRGGRTQAEAAAAVGVSQGRLARWEQSEDWPTGDRLHALCYALGARPEEAAALTAGVRLGAGAAEDDREADPTAWEERIRRAWQERHPLRDLRLLTLEARLWHLAADSPAMRPLLMSAYACHARSLSDAGRPREVHAYTERALDLARAGYGAGEYWAWAVIAAAAAMRGGRDDAGTAARRRGREAAGLLAAWEGAIRHPANKAWLRADLAKALLLGGDPEAALARSEAACREAEDADNPHEAANRQNDHAVLLAQTGRFGLALEALDKARPLADLLDETRVAHLILEAECLLGLGQGARAHDALAEAFRWCERPDLRALRPRAETLVACL